MSTVHEVFDEALHLDERHRATLALRLLDSISLPDPRDDASWLEEIERRARRAFAEGPSGRDVDDAVDSIARDLGL